MLQYTAHTHLTNITKGTCTTLCVYDEQGNLISFVAPFGKGRYVASTVTDADFENWVKILSLNKTVPPEDI